MNEVTLQSYGIDGLNLADMILCAKTRTREYWERKVPLRYPDTIVMGHTIIDKFKFFTIYPACLYFYIDDQYNVIKEPVCVKVEYLMKINLLSGLIL